MAVTKKSILHIEDDPDIHTYVDALLNDVAYVTSVFTAREAKQLLIGSAFDLFILDLVLKDASGATLARDLKEAFPGTPVIILSSHDVTGAIEESDASFIKGKMDDASFIDAAKKLLR